MPQIFCTECGSRLLKNACFCTECGTRAAGAGTRKALPRLSWPRWAPVFVFSVTIAVAGSAVLFGTLIGKPPPRVPPRSPSSPAVAALPEGHPPVDLPGAHPPVELPEDVRAKIEEIVSAAQARPDDIEAWKKAGMVQYRAGQLDPSYLYAAAKSYAHVLERMPTDLESLRAMGNIAYDQNQPEQALQYYERYLKQKPDDPYVLTDMGTMYLSAKNAPRAIETYQRVLAADPKFFQAQFNLAIAYRFAGDNEKALAALVRARDIASDDQTRAQVSRILAQVSGTSVPATPAAPNIQPVGDLPLPETGSLRGDIEGIFRQHPIVGSRVDRFDWSGDHRLTVVLRDFPMETMPPFARQKLVERIKKGVVQVKKRHSTTDITAIELVDASSGKTMESVSID